MYEEAHSACYFAKAAPLACWSIASMVQVSFLKSVQVKDHMNIR